MPGRQRNRPYRDDHPNRLLRSRQRTFEQASRRGEIALFMTELGEIGKIVRRVRVIGAESSLVDRQRPLRSWRAAARSPSSLSRRPKITNSCRRRRMVGTERLFHAGERALEQRPRRRKVPLVAEQ